jgi:CMP-N,N'-diacetyllegionaminic acid synthase
VEAASWPPSVLAVIPARAGSKRVAGKNIRPLGGKPLLGYTIEAAISAGLQEQLVVSTESAEIAEVARHFGAGVVDRPAELAVDEASTESVLLHAIDSLAGGGQRYTWVMTLPPTSPFRGANTIRQFLVEIIRAPDAQDCLMSVSENRGDFWQRDSDTGVMQRLFPDAPRRQQDRMPLYEENSALYITWVDALRETKSVLGRKVRGLVIDPREAWDINTEIDFKIAEVFFAHESRT